MKKIKLPEIRQSLGTLVPITGGRLVGNGVPDTAALQAQVDQAAVLLRDTFGVSVEKRYNNNGRSGGAWVITDGDKRDIFGNGSIGITAGLSQKGSLGFHVYVDADYLHDPSLATHKGFQHAHPEMASVVDALDWVKTHVRVPAPATPALDEGDARTSRAPRPR